jgi:ABC-type branched-subunit amino acid transport system substrate-binding protein
VITQLKMKRALLAVATLTAASCTFLLKTDECTTSADCTAKGAGLTCVDKLCVSATVTDAGPVDAGPADAGPVDAGPNRCEKILGDPNAANVLLWGAVLPFTTSTGATDTRGQLRMNAIQLVVDSMNGAGGVASHPIAVRVCDDSGTGSVAGTLTSSLISQGAVAIITPGSGETLAVAGVAVPAGVLVISGSASSVQLGAAGLLSDGGAKLVWSTAASDDLQGRVLASILLGDGGVPPPATVDHPAALYRNDVYGSGLYATLNSTFRGATGTAVGQFPFDPGGATVATPVANASATTPSVVVVIGTPAEAASVINAWPGQDPVWMFSDNARAVSLVGLVDGGAGRLAAAIGTSPSVAGSASQAYGDFASDYIGHFTTDPSTTSYIANTYDATMLLAVAAAYASGQPGGITGENMAQGLTQLSAADAGKIELLEPNNFPTITSYFTQNKKLNVQGASGDLDFDPSTGVAPGPIDIWKVYPDGGLVTVQTIAPK